MATAQTDRAAHKGYELPPYRVEQSEGRFEVRGYGPHIVAEVTVAGDRSTAINRGFRVLAGYIFGGNETQQKVAITVPVAQSGGGDLWTVRFMMPSRYGLGTLPAPKDGRIRFIEVPAERQVVLRFSGFPGEARLAGQVAALRSWAEAKGLRLTEGPHYYFYDAPMTLPWNRRNEVAFTIE